MCKFLSLVVTKSGKVYGDGSFDEHEKLIVDNVKKDKELKDDKNPPNNTFARIEIIPKDKDIFNHKINNWEFRIDERIEPKWWKKDFEKPCYDILKKVFKTQFLIGGEYDEINKDIRFIKDVKIKVLKSKVGEMWGSSQVGKMWDSSQVGEMLGSSQVGKMWDSSQVGRMLGSSQVGEMLDSSQVGEMLDSSHVGKMLDSSQVGEMWGSNTINVWSRDCKIKTRKNGQTVVIKRYLKNVEVNIK